jgi:hypothetical protein
MATPNDTNSTFIGSGALSWDWYQEIDCTGGANTLEPSDDWAVTFALPSEDEDTPGKRYTLDHRSIMRAVNMIVRTDVKGVNPHGAVRRECRAFLSDPDECDFDAATADCVMQVAAFGEVVYA